MTQHFISRNENITLDYNKLAINCPMKLIKNPFYLSDNTFTITGAESRFLAPPVQVFTFELGPSSAALFRIDLAGRRISDGAIMAVSAVWRAYRGVPLATTIGSFVNNFNWTGGGGAPSLFEIVATPPAVTFRLLLTNLYTFSYSVTVIGTDTTPVDTVVLLSEQ